MKNIKSPYSAIHKAVPLAVNVRKPDVKGNLDNVLFADYKNNTYVFKFSNYDLAYKNLLANILFNNRGIKVPATSVYEHKNQWVETYAFLPGQTFYSAIKSGMNKQDIDSVFKQIVDAFIAMSTLDKKLFKEAGNYKLAHNIAKNNVAHKENIVFGNILSWVVFLLNKRSEKNIGIYHVGLTPKNILLDKNGKLSSILDLDEIVLCDKNYAFSRFAAKYKQLGFKVNDLIDYYESKTSDKLDRKKILRLVNINNLGSKLLGRNR